MRAQKDLMKKNTAQPKQPGMKSIAIIFAVGLCCYGLILFTNYVIWDGWWYAHIIKNRSENAFLYRILKEIGRPQDILYFAPFFLTDNIVFLGKILGVCGWILASVFQYLFFCKGLKLPWQKSLTIALIGLACPIFTFWGEMTYTMYVFSVMFFWMGWALTAERMHLFDNAGKDNFVARILAVVVFVLSFELNSNIAHLYGVFVLVAIFRAKLMCLEEFKISLLKILARYGELLVLPTLYWILKVTITPTGGYYANYNKVDLNIKNIVAGYGVLVGNAAGYLHDFLSQTFIPAAIVTCIAGFLVIRKNTALEKFASSAMESGNGRLAVGGVFLTVCAPFSYLAVGQIVGFGGWEARNTILLNVPVAMVLVAVLSAITNLLFWKRPQFFAVASLYIVISGMILCNLITLRWQAFGAKQEAIQMVLREFVRGNNDQIPGSNGIAYTNSPRPVNVINLRDYFNIPYTIGFYPPIIWTYLVAEDSSEPTVFVFETTRFIPDTIGKNPDGTQSRKINLFNVGSSDLWSLKEDTQEPYALTKIPLEGTTATFAVLPGKSGDNGALIGFKYLLTRFFEPDSLKTFVLSVATVVEIK